MKIEREHPLFVGRRVVLSIFLWWLRGFLLNAKNPRNDRSYRNKVFGRKLVGMFY